MKTRALYFLAEAEAAGRQGFVRLWQDRPILCDGNPCGFFDLPNPNGKSIQEIKRDRERSLGFSLYLKEDFEDPPQLFIRSDAQLIEVQW